MTGASFFDVLILLGVLATLAASAFLGQVGPARRMVSVIAVLFGATLVVSGMLRIIPGDPIESILGDQAPQDARQALALELGLQNAAGEEIGFVAQYGRFVRGVGSALVLTCVSEKHLAAVNEAKEHQGFDVVIHALSVAELKNYRGRRPVRRMLSARLPYTLWLASVAMLIAVLLGVTIGVLAAWKKGGVLDAMAMLFAISGVALPRPALGPLLLLFFALTLGWFPVSGADTPQSVVLPALSLGTALAAVLARLTRGSLLEVLHDDYVRTARAKGMSEKVVLFKHALKNALIPVLTVIGLQLGAVLAGAVITEKIFVWPGIGLLLLESVRRLDVPVVQMTVLTIASFYVLANLATDLLYHVVDPRMRDAEGGAS
ncbi:MAG: ABC transporter permease [Deltaproteobacteria bacterium]|nr:ABC transporter permease [Deltaproteobacteria bacterium]